MNFFLPFFYLVTALIWFYRARRALEALRENPQIKPAAPPSSSECPFVSILLPVKNEEANLEDCLQGLLRQDYPALEVIVINDNSIDRTQEILFRHAQTHGDRLQALKAPPTPTGWTGKNAALAHGARIARGKWLLFTDADTRHEPFSVSSAVAHTEGKDLDLLTLSPKCLAESFWEKVIQPTAMAFMGLWFPFFRVNRPASSLAFGNGQYLMIRRKTYETLGGHARVKEAYLEDFALVREAKKTGSRIECAVGTKIFGTRMYRSFLGIWLGWRRIFLHAFEKNPRRLATKAFSVFCFSVLPLVCFPFLIQLAFVAPASFGKLLGAVLPILALIFITTGKAYNMIGAPAGYALLHPVAGFVLSAILIDAAWAAWRKKELKWR